MSNFPTKPAAPALQASHSFASLCAAAWLFTDSPGVTLRDYVGTHHLTGTGISNGSWGNDGSQQSFLHFDRSRMRAGASYSEFQHTTAEPWSITMLLRRTGDGGNFFDRVFGRTGDIVSLALQNNDQFGFAFFTGSWQNSLGASSVSGAYEHWAITYDGTDFKVYKDSALKATKTTTAAATGQFSLGGPDDSDLPAGEYFIGDLSAVFYHRRALTAGDITANYSLPYAAFTPPASTGGGDIVGLGFDFTFG